MDDRTSLHDALQEAASHHQAGRLADAESLYRRVLARWPDDPDASHNLGVLTMQRGGALRDALPLFATAWRVNPTNSQHGLSYLRALVHAGDVDAARALHADGARRGFAWPPPEALRPGGARAANAAVDDPAHDEAEMARAFQRGDLARFEALARALVQKHPDRGPGWKGIGFLAMRQGRRDEALQAMARAARALPTDPEPLYAMGTMLADAQRFDQAEAVLRQALALRPAWGQAHAWLGQVLQRQRRLSAAEESMRAALQRDPASFDALYGLGSILLEQARLEEAKDFYRRAIALQPDNLAARSTLLFTLSYAATDPPEVLLEEAREYGRRATARARPALPWACDASAGPLRVGLVSGDLGEHPVGYFLETVLEASRRRGIDSPQGAIEWIGYPTMIENDELSARLRQSLHGWRPIAGLADEHAAAMIRDDRIHVLIDLSGHSANNRLPLFASRPAPVQVSWLGYFATTGVEQMDAVLVDAMGVPDSERRWFTEDVRYLPDTRLCFSPPRTSLAVAAPPAASRRHVTFGSFQNAAKITDATLEGWSRVLAAVPGARLRVQNTSLGDGAFAAAFLQRLGAHGIAASRVALAGAMPREGYFAAHAEVDILLDTFPYPGGTTTCEALWMGVPTVTLAGRSLIARQGASLLGAAGLPDWVAESFEDYVALAAAKAGDVQALAALRGGLRERVASSPLFDAPRFAGHLSAELRRLWEELGVARLRG